MRRYAGAAVCLLVGMTVRGYGLSLDDAVRAALGASERVRRAESDVRAADLRVKRGLSAFAPRVTVGTGYARTETPASKTPDLSALPPAMLPAVAALEPMMPRAEEVTTNVTAVLPLYAGGARFAALGANRLDADVRRALLAAERAAVARTAAEKYYAYLKCAETAEIAAENARTVTAHRERAERLREQGLATGTRVTSFQVQEREADMRLRAARGAFDLARLELASLMGKRADDLPVPDPVAGLPPRREVAGPQAGDAALAHRPEIRAAELRGAMAGKGVGLARAGFLPRVNLAYAYGWQEEDAYGFDQDDRFWQFSGSVELNVFNGGADRFRVGEARCAEEAASAALDELRTGVRLQAEGAAVRYGLAYDAAEVAAAREELAREYYDQTAAGFEQGVLDELHEKDARTALNAARAAAAAARYDALIAERCLAWAMGGAVPAE